MSRKIVKTKQNVIEILRKIDNFIYEFGERIF